METCSGEASAAVSLHSAEFKLLQAYCSRRRRKTSKRKSAFDESQVTPVTLIHTSQPNSEGLLRTRINIRHQGVDELGNVAAKLTKIADHVDLDPDIVCDDGNDDIIQRLVELLRVAGDELDGELQKNPILLQQLQGSFTYNLFEKVTRTFLDSVIPSWAGSTKCTQQTQTQIAMTCEVTSRLSALDLQPMNRVMGFGAQFLQQHFSGWVQKYGGWEKAFDGQDNEDEVQ